LTGCRRRFRLATGGESAAGPGFATDSGLPAGAERPCGSAAILTYYTEVPGQDPVLPEAYRRVHDTDLRLIAVYAYAIESRFR
jgi:hypothetical protein